MWTEYFWKYCAIAEVESKFFYLLFILIFFLRIPAGFREQQRQIERGREKVVVETEIRDEIDGWIEEWENESECE